MSREADGIIRNLLRRESLRCHDIRPGHDQRFLVADAAMWISEDEWRALVAAGWLEAE